MFTELKFREISFSKYSEIWEGKKQKNFLSSPSCFELFHGEKKFFGLFSGNKNYVLGGFRVIPSKLGKIYFAPRGVIANYEDFATLDYFFSELKNKEKPGKIIIEPPVIVRERDIDGREVPQGKNNDFVYRNLTDIGFSYSQDCLSDISWQFVLDLTGKDEDKILCDMKGNTRRRLKQALELKMTTRPLKRDEMEIFFKIHDQTADRKGFSTRNHEYFYEVFDKLVSKGEADFVATFINPESAISSLKLKKKEVLERESKTIREAQDKEDAIKSLDTRIARLKECFSGVSNLKTDIPVSVGMFIYSSKEIVHVFGGNDSKYLRLDGQYVMTYSMILKGIREGYSRYNFYGIPKEPYNKPKDFGVYEYKRGFSGVCEEYFTDFSMNISKRAKLFSKFGI